MTKSSDAVAASPTDKTRARGNRTLRRLLFTVALFVGAILIAVFASGSTYALWNGSKPIGAASLSTGTTGLTVNGVTVYTVPGLTTTRLLPGLAVVAPQVLTIKNTGSTPLSVSVGTTTFTDNTNLLAQNNNLAVTLFQSSTCAQSVDGTSTAAWTTPVVLAAGGTMTACLQVILSSTAPSTVQGVSATFTLPLVGTQVRNNP